METHIHFENMPTSESMENYAKKKLDLLFKKYDWIIKTDVTFKKENDHKGLGKICDIILSIPGPDIHASSNEKNYELAFKNSLSDVEIQLKKDKQQRKPYI